MKWIFAIVIVATFVLLVDIVDRWISKLLQRRKEKHIIEMGKRCDQTEARADELGHQIIAAMEDVDNCNWMSPEEKEHFLSRYQALLDNVAETKQDVVSLKNSL